MGLWFYQTYWLNNNLAFIDAIIRCVESQGANVIPVFHQRYKDVDRGNRGADYIVDHFFMDGDRPRIQVLINPLLFSLTLAAPEYKDLLPRRERALHSGHGFPQPIRPVEGESPGHAHHGCVLLRQPSPSSTAR